LPLWAARSVAGFLGFSGEDIGPLPSGSLSITHALIAEAGTSAAILEALACCLGALMADAAGVLTNDRVAKIVRDGLRQGFAARR
jgi:hypothetical protein